MSLSATQVEKEWVWMAARMSMDRVLGAMPTEDPAGSGFGLIDGLHGACDTIAAKPANALPAQPDTSATGARSAMHWSRIPTQACTHAARS